MAVEETIGSDSILVVRQNVQDSQLKRAQSRSLTIFSLKSDEDLRDLVREQIV